jgi:hypothetical protein
MYFATCSRLNPSPTIRAGILRKNGIAPSARNASGGLIDPLLARTRVMTLFCMSS